MNKFFRTIAKRTRHYNQEVWYEGDWTLVRSGFWVGVIIGTLIANFIATILTIFLHHD